MPRLRAQISGQRLRDLIAAALTVFCRQGYERSQVADVAKVMGVAPGTIYLYVEGKEALFDLVIRHTASEKDNPNWLDNLVVPVPTPAPNSTLEFLRDTLNRKGQWPLLQSALQKATATAALTTPQPKHKTKTGSPSQPRTLTEAHQPIDIRSELDGIIREQYRLMTRHRAGLVLLMRSALEFPGLADVFVLGLRKRLLEALERYLIARIESGHLRPLANPAATAAVLTQTIAWANLQRPFDPGLNAFTEQSIEDATVDLIVSGLL